MLYSDLLDSGIAYSFGGKFISQKPWTHPKFLLDTWEFIYMIRGHACLYEGDTRFEVNAGGCVWFRPGIEHGGYAESTEPVSFFWLHCRAPADNPALGRLPMYAEGMQGTQIPLYCRQILHVSQLHKYPREMSDTLMRLLLTEYDVQTGAAVEATPETRRINEICEWIRINTKTGALSVSDVAGQFQYHEDYLTRLFRDKIGMGVKAYIDKMRMDHIRERLLSTDESLKSIAVASGFDDYKAFLKFFTYHETITPTELRERFYRLHMNNH